MTGKRKKALFVFYVLATGAILLYLLFPADAVRDHLINRIHQNFPNVEVSIGSLRLAFPPALSLTEVAVLKNDGVLFSIKHLKLTPRWRSVFLARKVIGFHAQAYRGDVSGSVSIVRKGESAEASISGKISDIHLEEVAYLREKTNLSLAGALSGNFQLDASSMQPITGSGNVVVSDCNFAPPVSFLDMKTLEFQRMAADLDFQGNSLEIQNGEMEGPELSGTVAGSIFFESPISRSEMDLEISVTPLLSSTVSGINNKLNFRATETFEDPKLTLVSAR